MSNEIEALGALATAGLAASVLDKPSARRRVAREQASREARWWRRTDAHAVDGHVPGTCANCTAALIGEFCHACGQSSHVHRSVGHVFEEFLHGIWHFDSKAWRTLPLLVFRPGRLTRAYTHGQRARFIAPLALFLLSVFLMFFVFSFVGGPNLDNAVLTDGKTDRVSTARAAVAAARAEVVEAEAELKAERADTDTPRAVVAVLERGLAAERKALVDAQAELAAVEASPADAPKREFKAKAGQSWQEALADEARTGEFSVDTGFPAMDANIRKALRNPEFAFYKVQQKAYKLSFLLVPLSLPVLWLIFLWRRDVRLYDHVVFSLYSLSFMSLLLVVAVAIPKITDVMGLGIAGVGLLIFVPPVHMFAQVKGGYALGTFSALWRTAVLIIASIVTLSMFAGMIIVLGLAD